MWCSFPDLKTFTAWHDQVCADEGVPYPGYNQGTDVLALDACWTTSYVVPLVDQSGAILVQLADTDPHGKGLTAVKAPAEPKSIDDPPALAVAADVAKSLPKVWRDQTGTKPIPRTSDNQEVTDAAASSVE